MSDPQLRLSAPRPVSRHDRAATPVGRQLVNAGLISQTHLLEALAMQRSIDAPLGEILVAQGHVARDDVLLAIALQYDAERVDLDVDPPSPLMAAALSADLCQRHRVVPWRWIGTTLLVATSRPDQLDALRADLGSAGGDLLPVIADDDQIIQATTSLFGPLLAQRAVTKVADDLSCRNWSLNTVTGRFWLLAVAAATLLGLVLAPAWVLTVLVGWGVLTLLMTTTLKTCALIAQITVRTPSKVEPLPPVSIARKPRVSVMVPLFKEERIAEALIERLARITYPKALLDVILVLEAKDTVTRATLARTNLPTWMHVIEVPDDGKITTKPRALNYALDFCRGDIIGVWDAEDAPEPDQLDKVVTHFAQAGPKVACVQGILDYYNAKQNWLACCFTVEYAAWWRLILPGVERLGLVLPLGGTTLFFRRKVLEDLGGWDAHNVTEDADLGIRLARQGYTTELIPTVTYEEANCRAWPWVKQRSRWLKGFLITYFVHMRNPVQLWRDLGFKRFMGIQAMLLATVSQFAALPVLWSFWMTTFGLSHPTVATLGASIVWPLAALFLFTEVLSVLIGMLAVSDREHRHLIPWALALPIYFTLGALACYKALYEMMLDPFYWDKTQHG